MFSADDDGFQARLEQIRDRGSADRTRGEANDGRAAGETVMERAAETDAAKEAKQGRQGRRLLTSADGAAGARLRGGRVAEWQTRRP